MEKQEYVYNAYIVSVYDGDTIHVDVDLGFKSWQKDEPLRLIGINAPEMRGPEKEAGIVSRDWLRGNLPIGSKVVIRTIKDRGDKYGRYLAEVFVGDLSLNVEMKRLGLARPFMEE